MGDILTNLPEYVGHPAVLATITIALIVYQLLSHKIKAVPKIPMMMVTIFLLLELTTVLLRPYDIGKMAKYLDIASTMALYFVIARLAVAFFIEFWLGKMRKKPLPVITRDFVLAVTFIVITLWVLRSLGGINLASILTTSAILTAVIGLALQDTLGSFFAGLSLQIEQPFQIGDWISFREFVGRVVGISWRSTRIMTRFGELIYIPNNQISREVLKNFSHPDPTHIVTIDVGLEYGMPPNKVRSVLLEAVARHPNVVKDYATTVRVSSFGDFSILYTIFTKINDLAREPLIIAEIRNLIWYALKRSGIKIPYPTRVSYNHDVDEEQERMAKLSYIVAKLARIPILAPLSKFDLEKLAAGVFVEHYAKGEDIVVQGNDGDSMYLIQEGACDVLVSRADGSFEKVALLTEGNFFGEMSLLTGEKRTATVRAVTDCVLLMIGKLAFQEMLETHPDVLDGLAAALAARQAALDKVGKKAAPVEIITKSFLNKIKDFFGIRAR